MPLPTSIDDLSVIPGDNFPEGTDSPDVLDNVIREHAAYIAELRDGQDSTVRADLASTASGKGAGMLAYSPESDYAAGTVGAKMREYVSITDLPYGAVSGTDSTAAIAAASAYCTSREVSGDVHGNFGGVVLVIPRGVFPISAAVELPRAVLCHGKITGAHDVRLTQKKKAHIEGLQCEQLVIDGLWFSDVTRLSASTLTVRGGGSGYGTFWNNFSQIQADVIIDLSNWSVNQNRFSGRGRFTSIGAGALVLDGHMNNTDMWDATPGQISNTASVQQDSVLSGVYYEAGADIAGPFHVFGAHGDSYGPPQVNRNNHIFGTTSVVERNSRDFLAVGSNILLGGCWDFLDAAGKPPCIASAGGASAVSADATEPFGMGSKFGGTFTDAFTGLSLTIPPCKSGKFAIALAYQGPDFASIEVERGGGGGTSYGGASSRVIDNVNNWKLLRISGNASATHSTAVNLIALVAPGVSTVHIGGMYGTQEKAALLPAPSPVRSQQGVVTQGYVAGAAYVDVPVVFQRPFSSTPNVMACVMDNGQPQVPNFTKSLVRAVTSSGFTVRVYYTAEWAGAVSWSAIGAN